ncbi:Hypothetical protein HVR_LOCUS1278 [uncultured virus]|nr:Hypothetical protein HVR_LOCUS1278 [uncultured virus]
METQPNQPIQPETTQIPQALPNFATYNDYTNTRLSCTPPEQKTVPGTGPGTDKPPAFYYQVPLMYNFGTPEVRALNDFMFEGCEMETGFGIQSKPGQSGRLEHTVMVRFDSNNPEHTRLLESVGQIHAGCCFILQQYKGAVKLYDFNATAPGGLFKSPVYRPRDDMTGDYIQGRAPSMFLKLFSRGKPPMVEQTLFTGLDGKPIPWTLLQGVEMKFIPLIHVKRIYVGGGKASLQMEVVSAVVTSIRARNTTTRQMGTIQRLQQSRPELIDTVAAQIAKLTIDRQDQMLGVPSPAVEQAAGGTEQPTYAGIAPTVQRQPAQPVGHHQQYTPPPAQQYTAQIVPGVAPPVAPGVLPTIPALGGTTAMQDFTATAPTRAPVIPAVTIPGAAPKAPSPGVQTPTTIQLN